MSISETGVGCLAPDFTLPGTDQDGTVQPWHLSDYRGRIVALVFYPKDETPVCTKQMCSMRDRWQDYQQTGAEVVAISIGSIPSHQQFAANHHFPQKLLADEQGEVTRLYKLRSLLGGSQRAVIVIDANGIIRFRRAVLPFLRPSDADVIAAIQQAMSAQD
jgi:peroxiredoxin Q/BCP